MNEERLKDLRNTLRPLREARAILGDELMSDEDDEELMEAFISTDYAIENIKRATGLSPREPRPLGPARVSIHANGTTAMAKPTTIQIKLESTAGTGYYYVTKKNPRNITEKMTMKKYDPVLRKHVDFKEGKIK